MAEESKVTGFFQFTRNQFKEDTFDDLKDFIDIPEEGSSFNLDDFTAVNDFDTWRNGQMKDDLNAVFTSYTYGSDQKNFRSISDGNMVPLETEKLDETDSEAEARLNVGILENSAYNWSIDRIKRLTSEKWSLWNVLYNLLYHLSKEQYYLENVVTDSGSKIFDFIKHLYSNLDGKDSYDSKQDMFEQFRSQGTSLKDDAANENDGVASTPVG